MTKETLNEKRKEIDRMLVKSGLDMLTIKLIHDKIKEQDKEFIKLLKEELTWGVNEIVNDEWVKKKIDKLAGFALIDEGVKQ